MTPLNPFAFISPQQLQAWQTELAHSLAALWQRILDKGARNASTPTDKRFADPAWSESPIYAFLCESYLLLANSLYELCASAPYPDGKTKCRALFYLRQWLDAIAPSNFAATNPEFIAAALATQGKSIEQGIQQLLSDLRKGRITQTDEHAFRVGENLATTPGAVVYRNRLIELIQYAPQTEKVGRYPLLIVPPCINKYYILDLAPERSFVRFALQQGFTVFLISWKNPQWPEAMLTWDDYLQLGPLEAFAVARAITGEERLNVLGFCIGGTILASALAVAAAKGDTAFESLTLLTSLLDFAESGELGCLVDEAHVAMREASVGKGGLISGNELYQLFAMLRANDLIWPYVVKNYLKGEALQAFDLLYWNGDSTNLPGPFAAYYLRHMYLENELRIPNRLTMLGVPVDLGRLDYDSYILATREDHIVPWRGAYYSQLLLPARKRFVLGASGHIAGVINPAAQNRRCYWCHDDANLRSPELWLAQAQEHPGSWWRDWAAWIAPHKGAERPAPRSLGSPHYPVLAEAPGAYVLERAS